MHSSDPRPLLLALALTASTITCSARVVWVPVLDSGWWQIAENSPDVAPYNNYPNHNACDFTIYQASNGVWQLVACIRDTAYPGRTRLFHCWQGSNLTDTMWAPARIANTFYTNGVPVTVTNGIFAVSQTNPPMSQTEGRMQAPHCFKHNGRYYMFYNSNGAYCKISDDGIHFTDHTNVYGSYHMFSMGRDVMIFHPTNSVFAAYFENGGYMASRTAPTPEGPWSDPAQPIGNEGNPESPFAVRYRDDYYLWQQLFVYQSTNYLNFDVAKITKMTTGMSHGRYAPEVLLYNGQYYVAGYGHGIWLAKMRWEQREVTDADLVWLEVTTGSMTPAFAQTTTWYTVSVSHGVDSNYCSYLPAQEAATILLNGTPATGHDDLPVPLDFGVNLAQFAITSEDATAHKVYTIQITRAANPGALHPEPSANVVTVLEGGTNTFGLRLNADPGTAVTVTVSKVYGDTDIALIGGDTLVFTPGTYSDFQNVTVAAQYDTDGDDGVALFTCAGPGMDSFNVLVHELDQRVGTVIHVDVDLGAVLTTGTWNNLTAYGAGSMVSGMTTRTGDSLPVVLQVTRSFDAVLTNGMPPGPFPATAQQDGFLVLPGTTAEVAITGLEDAHTYDLVLFGSAGVAQDDFRARYASDDVHALLDTVNNRSKSALLENLASDGSGVLAIEVERMGSNAADHAALNAFELYQRPSGATLYFDFGPTATPGNWNIVSDPGVGTAVGNAVDADGQLTGVQLAITDAFYQSSSNEGIDTNTLYPATVQHDCFRTSNATDPSGGFQVRGLNPARKYDFAFYAAAWRTTGTRGSDFVIGGQTVTLPAIGNVDTLAVISNVTPDGAGTVAVTVNRMPGASYGYLNAMEIRPAGGASAARTFRFDCGVPGLPTTGAWNNLTVCTAGTVLSNIIDTDGLPSPLLANVSNGFSAAAVCGVDADDVFPRTAQYDGFALHPPLSNALLVISGLPSNAVFDLTCFGSYAALVPDRRTCYRSGTATAVLDARNNHGAVTRLNGLTSHVGQILLQISCEGTNAVDAGCLNVLGIDIVIPEPGSVSAAMLALTVLVFREYSVSLDRRNA